MEAEVNRASESVESGVKNRVRNADGLKLEVERGSKKYKEKKINII